MTMNIHYIIHASFEKLGAIRSWAEKNGHELTETNNFKGEPLPSVNDFDFLMTMGGPQSSLELEKHPYLAKEVELIKKAIEHDKYILGVCLGAQLIGQAMGAQPEKSPAKEVGTFPITLTAAGKDNPLFKNFPDSFDVMHWHSDMPGVPNNAEILAYSDGCPRQIVKYGDKIYGFQCHLELTKQTAKDLIASASEDLTHHDTYVQTPEQILAADFAAANNYLHLFLDRLVAG